MALGVFQAIGGFVLAWLALRSARLFYNVFLHPLRRYPGPIGAHATDWYKTYIELFQQKNWTDQLLELHKQYGKVIRVGPNEIHFSQPESYHDIYNPSVRWDKEKALYECFGEDHSSFGFQQYREAKLRKDVLQPLFSRRSILDMQSLVRKNMDHLVEKLAEEYAGGKSSDLFFAFRCLSMDTITTFCFARSVDATDVPGFNAPIIEAMEAAGAAFITFKHLPWLRKLIFSLPPDLAIKASPQTAGLTQLQVILRKQVDEVTANPDILKDAPHKIIYHRLLDPEVYKGQPVPSRQSLYEEAQTLMFGGGDTVGNTLMVGFNYVLKMPDLYARLRAEVKSIWPDLKAPPELTTFETLPLLTATLKESLRISPGVPAPLLRVVPSTGATIASHVVPGGTIVGISGVFVHMSPQIFEDPEAFKPERWLTDVNPGAKDLEQWLVAFSRGPRSCLGINLAWCELYIAFATMLRVFELEIDKNSPPADLRFRDTFLPWFYGDHLKAWCKPVSD